MHIDQPRPKRPTWKRLVGAQEENNKTKSVNYGKRKGNEILDEQDETINKYNRRKKKKLEKEDDDVVTMEIGYDHTKLRSTATKRQADREP